MSPSQNLISGHLAPYFDPVDHENEVSLALFDAYKVVHDTTNSLGTA